MFNRQEYLEFCTVGDLDLLPKFRSTHPYFSCNVAEGRSIGWVMLPFGFNIEWGTKSWDVHEIARLGYIRLTRDMSEHELDAQYESDWA